MAYRVATNGAHVSGQQPPFSRAGGRTFGSIHYGQHLEAPLALGISMFCNSTKRGAT
jgi:hypothetical protein